VAGDEAESVEEGIKKAMESIDKGKAMDKLKRLVEFSQGFSA
jgi:anthranilate phosphoribosyltransferase